MSRSRRKTPIHGHGNGSEKSDKKYINQSIRRKTRILLKKESDDVIFPIKEEVLDTWDMSKDGKSWFDKNGSFGPEMMRK